LEITFVFSDFVAKTRRFWGKRCSLLLTAEELRMVSVDFARKEKEKM
jgi:hypothetical protein